MAVLGCIQNIIPPAIPVLSVFMDTGTAAVPVWVCCEGIFNYFSIKNIQTPKKFKKTLILEIQSCVAERITRVIQEEIIV